MAMLRKDPNVRETSECYQWRENFDLLLADPNVPYTFVCESSIRYAQDRPSVHLPEDIAPSVPPGNYVRKYSTGEFGAPISIIAKAWESSLSPPRQVLNLRHPDNLFVDIPPFGYIFEKYLPYSVCDVGCGIGAYLKVFQSFRATEIFGIDCIPADATILDETEYALHDLSGAFRLGRKFDLVVCVEVAEHVKDSYAERLLSDIDGHSSGIIIFSAAERGQPGNGLINCPPNYQLAAKVEKSSLGARLGDGFAMRSLATLSWLRVISLS